jgi:phenylpropionate dioxygenase-like ring-hydroxylating dioxygenase large terminal subunit
MDRAAKQFDAVMANVLPILDNIGLGQARVNWWRALRVEANWKIALEAFLESYHILQTHPELTAGAVGDDYDADAFSYTLDEQHGHGWINDAAMLPLAGISPAAYMVLTNRVLFDGVDGWLTPVQNETMESLWSRVPDELTEDEFLQQFYEQVYDAGATTRAPLPETPALGLAFVFPNTALINNLGNSMIYRFLPDPRDPEVCTWEIWSVSPAPEDEPLRRPTCERLDGQRALPPVYAQDASNMELQQKGVRAGGFTACIYSPAYEPMIPNMHRQIDRMLAR